MDPRLRGRNTTALWGSVAVAAAYAALLFVLRAPTGEPRLDATIGVVLGLYVCSQPAANAIDLFFFPHDRAGVLSWSSVGWVGLNALTVAVGWLFIFFGAAKLVG